MNFYFSLYQQCSIEYFEIIAHFEKLVFSKTQYNLSYIIISLHTRSVWNTIYDTSASRVWQIFCSKFLECPYSSIWGMLVWSTPPHGNLVRTSLALYFGFELAWSTPLPQKWKFGQDLALLIWVGLEYHPPLKLCGSWCVETNHCIPKHPAGTSINSVCFWAYQSILTSFYNGGVWENIFWSIHTGLIHFYCTIIFFILGRAKLHWNISSWLRRCFWYPQISNTAHG